MVTFASIEKLLSGWLERTDISRLVESTGMIRSRLNTPSLFFGTSLPTSERLDCVLKWNQVGKISFIPVALLALSLILPATTVWLFGITGIPLVFSTAFIIAISLGHFWRKNVK